MSLVNTKEMLKKAYKENYAVGAFNVNNMEIVQGITKACQELKSPVILQVSAGARRYASHTYLMKLVEAAVQETSVPIALHLDHGDSFELCKSCIDGGFTSVMIEPKLRRKHRIGEAGCRLRTSTESNSRSRAWATSRNRG